MSLLFGRHLPREGPVTVDGFASKIILGSRWSSHRWTVVLLPLCVLQLLLVWLLQVELELGLLLVKHLLLILDVIDLVASPRSQVSYSIFSLLLLLLVHVVDLRSLTVMLFAIVLLAKLIVVRLRSIFLVRLNVIEVLSYELVKIANFVTLLDARLFG